MKKDFCSNRSTITSKYEVSKADWTPSDQLFYLFTASGAVVWEQKVQGKLGEWTDYWAILEPIFSGLKNVAIHHKNKI
ncbi:hypothetical protein [Paenibacillus sp. NPDC057934]|uniref:hypothetical protein n=1 Tax=Paenibacillus sp. NPDC057934 TaxID=3346282 RepID=UPI0036DFA1C9